MNGVTGWDKSTVLKELLPLLTSYGVTYFQWEGLTVSFNAKTMAQPDPIPAPKPDPVPEPISPPVAAPAAPVSSAAPTSTTTTTKATK